MNAQNRPMTKIFWTNTIWYIALAAISAAMLFLALAKSPCRKKTLAFFFAVLGMTYFLEILLLVVMEAYTYSPKIASDSFHESLIGNFFSQYSVSAAAVLIATLGLNMKWRIGFSIAYFLVDMLFVQLNIYSHNWYNSWFTLGGFFVYSWIVMKWHGKVFSQPTKGLFIATLFLAVFSLYGNLFGTTLNFMEIQRFTIGLYEQTTKDNTAASVLYSIPSIAIIIPLCRLKHRPAFKGLLFLLLFVIDWCLYRMGFMHVKAGWFIPVTLFTVFGRYMITGFLDRSLGLADAPCT